MFWYACTFFAVLACVRVVTFWYGRTAHSSKKVLRKCLKMDNFVQTIQLYGACTTDKGRKEGFAYAAEY